MRIKNEANLWAGAMFLLVGVCFAGGSLFYSFGSSARPGPGYFPFGLGLLLALLGVFEVAKAVLTRDADDNAMHPMVWKPLITVVGSVLLFGITLPLLGLVLALPLLITVSALAGDEFRWRDAAISSVVLTLGSYGVFIYGLNLTIPLWPWFLA